MSARIITIAQQKGGAGKTTLAAQLVAAYLKAGKRVGAIDTDPQASLSAWIGMRHALLGGDPKLVHAAPEAADLDTTVKTLRKEADIVLIDSPPHAEAEARAAIRAADVVLVPMQPSPMDMWATQPTLNLAAAENVPYRVVLNRVPARGRLADEVLAQLRENAMPLTRTALGNRTAYASSMMRGRGVAESHARSRAALEMAALLREIARIRT